MKGWVLLERNRKRGSSGVMKLFCVHLSELTEPYKSDFAEINAFEEWKVRL